MYSHSAGKTTILFFLPAGNTQLQNQADCSTLITPYPLQTLLSPSPRSCDALCKSRSTKHKRWSLQLLLCNDMSIRSGQGPFVDSKKDLWLPKMHTVNKSEPKHVEA